VILLKDIPLVGQRGEVKEIKDGYFRNYLMPRHLAEIATPKKVREMEALRIKRAGEREELKNSAQKWLEKLSDKVLVFEAEANEKGHLFNGISAREIAARLKEKSGGEIKPGWIKLEAPIKELGRHKVEIKTPHGEGVLEISVNKKAAGVLNEKTSGPKRTSLD